MKPKALGIGIAAALLAVAAYWYWWSPLIVIRQMQTAAQAGDADAFNAHVDYPRLRESLKAQLSSAMTRRMTPAPDAGNNDFARAGAALGAMIGNAVIGGMVDAFVRPETVMRAMQEGRMMPAKDEQADSGAGTPAGGSSDNTSDKTSDKRTTWRTEHLGFNKYIAYASKPGEADDQRIALVLERSGFADWKLTEISLPALR